MRRLVVSSILACGALATVCGIDCRSYKDLVPKIQKREGSLKTLAYLQRLEEENPSNPCSYYARGIYYRHQGQYETALPYFQKAMAANPEDFGSHLELGWIYHALRDYTKAGKAYLEAIALASKLNDRAAETFAKINLAVLYLSSERPDKALLCLSEALNLSRKINRPDYEWRALVRMAETLMELGEMGEAKKACGEGLEILKAVNEEFLWSAYNMMGNISMASADQQADLDAARHEYGKAIGYYHQALTAARDPAIQKLLLVSLGDAYWNSDHPQTALQYYDAFLTQTKEKDRRFKENRSLALGHKGEIHLQSRRWWEALADLNQAIRWAREDKNKRMELSWRKSIGDVYAAKGEFEEARRFYDGVLQEVKDGFLEWGSESREERFMFFAEEAKVYEAIVDLLLTMDRQYPEKAYAREAFDYVEQARGQSILQALFQSRVVEKLLQDPSTSEFHKKLAHWQSEVDRSLKTRLQKNARLEKLRPLRSEEAARLETEIKALEVEIESAYKSIVRLIKQKLHDYDMSNLVERLRKERLSERESLIEYMVTEEKTFVFIIQRQAFHFEVLPLGRKGYRRTPGGKERAAGITRLLRKVSPLLASADAAAGPRMTVNAYWADIKLGALQELYQTLFQPIEKYLRPDSQLIIVPDDRLYYLPFEMLVTALQSSYRPQYLLARYPMAYSYSAGLLLERPRSSVEGRLRSLLMANPALNPTGQSLGEAGGRLASSEGFSNASRPLPPLPFAEREILKAGKVFRSAHKLVGDQATEATFKKEAPRADLIHLGTHSLYDRRNYLDSRIIFAQGERIIQQGEDGFLYLHEIMNLRLTALLVVLTGCETGQGRLRRGGGLEGMSRAFLSAGVASIMGALWPVVDSEATAGLVEAFYENLAQGLDKRTALQKAKLKTMTGPRNSDPFYWAPLILIGNTQALKFDSSPSFWIKISLAALPILLILLYLASKPRKIVKL